MPRLLPLTLIFLAACTPPLYVQPNVSEPHGTVKIRMVYHDPPQTSLNERVVLDETRVEGRFRPTRDTRVMPVRVTPGQHRWRIRAGFSHTELRQRMETYQERYQCGTDRDINGNSRTRYCNRTKQRWVQRQEVVSDGGCQVDHTLTVREGVTYVAQFDYFGHQRCTLRYLEQRAQPDGSFDLVPAS